eukprot:Opistho-1_new@104194
MGARRWNGVRVSAAVSVVAFALIIQHAAALKHFHDGGKVDVLCLSSANLGGGSVVKPESSPNIGVTCNTIVDGDTTFLTCAGRYVLTGSDGDKHIFGYDLGTTVSEAKFLLVSVDAASGEVKVVFAKDRAGTDVVGSEVHEMRGPSQLEAKKSGAIATQQGVGALDGIVCKAIAQPFFVRYSDPQCNQGGADHGDCMASTIAINADTSWFNVDSCDPNKTYAAMSAAPGCECADGSTPAQGDHWGELYSFCPWPLGAGVPSPFV